MKSSQHPITVFRSRCPRPFVGAHNLSPDQDLFGRVLPSSICKRWPPDHSVEGLIAAIHTFQQHGLSQMLFRLLLATTLLLLMLRQMNHAPFALVGLALFVMSWRLGARDERADTRPTLPFCAYFAARATLETSLRAVALLVVSNIVSHFVRLNPDLANAAHVSFCDDGVVWVAWIWTVIGRVLSFKLGLAA